MSAENVITVDQIGGKIRRDGDFATITLPVDQVQNLRVALQPCGCAANKTNYGLNLRKRLVRALGQVLFR